MSIDIDMSKPIGELTPREAIYVTAQKVNNIETDLKEAKKSNEATHKDIYNKMWAIVVGGASILLITILGLIFA